MTLRLVNRLSAVSLVMLLGVFSGCAGLEHAPKRGLMYYHKELPAADRAVEAARAAGKAFPAPCRLIKECRRRNLQASDINRIH